MEAVAAVDAGQVVVTVVGAFLLRWLVLALFRGAPARRPNPPHDEGEPQREEVRAAPTPIHEAPAAAPRIRRQPAHAEVEEPVEGDFDFDLVVIGGGSGGLAASKEAADCGAKVAVLDFVAPSPQGTTWGLGGTCVNVGCIPKKLMHRAAVLGEDRHDAVKFGWSGADGSKHKWEEMMEAVNNHVRSLNFGYRTSLRKKSVKYINAKGSLEDTHTVACAYFDKDGNQTKVEKITARHVLIAVGGRPRLPASVPGAREHCISSDDLFWRTTPPGKTLVVGASYVALECAGFVRGCGYDVTVMVRSILLRGFDQQMADKIGQYMEQTMGVRFVRGELPTRIERTKGGRLRVVYGDDGKAEEFDTVLYAIGRDPCTTGLGLDKAGVRVDEATGKIPVDRRDRTSVRNIHAIGDVALNPNPALKMLELTPVAIKSGRLLARRLFAHRTELMDYISVPTTVFTPLEYGCVGLSEDQAVECFGEDDVEVYHSHFQPLEWTVPHRDENACYCKVVCNKARNEEVLGIHYLGPNAGEVIQGFALAVKLNATKSDLDSLVGVHPTCAEALVGLSITKASGEDASNQPC